MPCIGPFLWSRLPAIAQKEDWTLQSPRQVLGCPSELGFIASFGSHTVKDSEHPELLRSTVPLRLIPPYNVILSEGSFPMASKAT